MGASAEAATTWARALAWRMARQQLDPVGSGLPADVVRRLGAVPSMDGALAEVAVRTRLAGSEPGELARALAAGTVIKAFAFRGAVHYLSAADGGVYLALRSASRQWELKSWVDHYGLAPHDWPDFRAAVREALGGGPLTASELGEVLTRHRAYRHLRPVFEEGAATLVKPLTWQGDMVLGPPRDGRATFQRLDENTHWEGIPDLEEAGPRAVTSYFRTYGPATLDRLHYWLGEGLSAGRGRITRWVSGLGDRLAAVDVEGTTALMAREDVEALLDTQPSAAVRFLPGHDQWVMGPGTSDGRVTPPSRRQLMTRKANPVISGGVVSGTWACRRDELVVTWLDDRPLPDHAVREEAARLLGLLGRDLRVRVEGRGSSGSRIHFQSGQIGADN